MSESIQKTKGRVRPPRVHITYDVDLNGAIQMKELPFVMGVLADLVGKSNKKQAKLRDRDFVTVDRDNFDDFLGSLQPRVATKVANKLTGEGELAVDITFHQLSDFGPDAVVQNVEPLRKLAEVRKSLQDLLSRTDGNDRLEELLGAVIENSDLRDKLRQSLGGDDAGSENTAGQTEGDESNG